jgi:hypothetical protein
MTINKRGRFYRRYFLPFIGIQFGFDFNLNYEFF